MKNPNGKPADFDKIILGGVSGVSANLPYLIYYIILYSMCGSA